MPKENLHDRYRNLFIISLSFIILFICVAIYLLYQSQKAQKWNEHRRQVEFEMKEVQSGIYETTAAIRGYLITGRLESIVPYKNAEAEISGHMQKAYDLVDKQKDQLIMMDSLSMMVDKRKVLLDELISIYKQSKYVFDSTADSRINNLVLEGDLIMEKIRIQVKSIISYEQYLYKQRIGTGDNFNRQAYVIIICFGIFTILVSLYGYLLIQRENNQKQMAQLKLKEYYSKLEQANIMLTEAEKLASMGSWEWDIETGKVIWSDGVYKVYQLSPDHFLPSYESFINIITEDDKETVLKTIEEAQRDGKSYHIEFRENSSGLNKTIYAVGVARFSPDGRITSYFGIIVDITQQRNYEKQLEEFNTALKKSNEELEQFAYVASHDLQEPLRKIRSFGDRFMSKYGQDGEFTGRDYILKMMDGAERMQILIQDLLAFSRVSRDAGDKIKVDLNETVKSIIEDLQLSISESNANIEIDKLPKLTSASPVQMQQLFLNLISNAIKFRKEDVPPQIHISCKTVKASAINQLETINSVSKNFYEISIRDNGIGFDEKYLDKIFTIFQRLHGRSEYKGTGIGLALCKKICYNHGGYITARSNGSGANFLIYLPK